MARIRYIMVPNSTPSESRRAAVMCKTYIILGVKGDQECVALLLYHILYTQL